MKQLFAIFLGLFFGALLAASFLLYKNIKLNNPPSFADAASKAAPSVVNIYTTKIKSSYTPNIANDYYFTQRRMRLERKRELTLGSGVIVESSGLVLTNYHVIKDAEEILILAHDNRQAIASIIGVDADTDLAILKISLSNLKAIDFGDLKKMRVGDSVLAIGNPYGFGQTVSSGIISAIGRYGLNLNTYENFIQTDAAISVGSSGGALINSQGEMIGINSANYSQNGNASGIGLATPVDIAKKVTNDIIEFGYVVRGWLGIEVTQLTPAIANQLGLSTSSGIIITNIYPNGPAHQAQLQPGDIITSIDDNDISNGQEGMFEVANLPPGTTIKVRAIRKEKAFSTKVTVGTRPHSNR